MGIRRTSRYPWWLLFDWYLLLCSFALARRMALSVPPPSLWVTECAQYLTDPFVGGLLGAVRWNTSARYDFQFSNKRRARLLLLPSFALLRRVWGGQSDIGDTVNCGNVDIGRESSRGFHLRSVDEFCVHAKEVCFCVILRTFIQQLRENKGERREHSAVWGSGAWQIDGERAALWLHGKHEELRGLGLK